MKNCLFVLIFCLCANIFFAADDEVKGADPQQNTLEFQLKAAIDRDDCPQIETLLNAKANINTLYEIRTHPLCGHRHWIIETKSDLATTIILKHCNALIQQQKIQ